MERQTKAYLYAMLAVLLWSTVATAFKLTLRSLTPVGLLFFGSATAALVLGLVLTLQGKLSLLRTYTRRDYARSALLGFLNPFLYYAVLFRAYQLLPGQEAQPLNYTWAIALALLSIPLLKQNIRPASLLALLISFTGVYVIATRGHVLAMRFTDSLGVSLALGSSIVWALFWIFSLRDPRDRVAKLFLSFSFGCLITGIYALITGQWVWPTSAGLLGAVYTGLFEMGITFLIWLRALSLSRTTAHVANLIFLSPFVSLVLLSTLAGERIYPSSVIGLVLIVGGILLQRRVG